MSHSILGIVNGTQLLRPWPFLAVTLVFVSHPSFAVDFPPEEGYVYMKGTCSAFVEIYGITDGSVEIQAEQVYACMYRSAPYDPDADGKRDVNLNLEIRSGSGYIEGVGDINISLNGSDQPGHIESLGTQSDFPAFMTLTTKKVYTTPIGAYYSDEEFYSGEISAFPPIGTVLVASPDPVPMRDAEGTVVGMLYPANITPLQEIPGGCPPGPAVSEWGLIVLTLLGMTLGTIMLARRRLRRVAGAA
ncbi:MAG: hypothetical protein ACYTFA_14570 [Planctomycetota bacterium]|jgi:hypothetical protein